MIKSKLEQIASDILKTANTNIISEIAEAFLNNALPADSCMYYLKEKYNLDDNSISSLVDAYTAFKPSEQLHYSDLKNPPLISVIVPTYKRKEMLCICLDSLLSQTYKNIEIIIIDDCSPDDTESVVKSKYADYKNIKYFRNAVNKNAGYNRHLGYGKSKGEYVIFFDDDDFYVDRDFLLKAVNLHQEYEDIAFVGANAFVQNSLNNDITISNLNHSGHIEQREYILNFGKNLKKPLSTFTAVFKKSCLEKAEFDGMQMMNDSPIYVRAILYGGAYILKDVIGVYRVHGTNISGRLPVSFIIDNLKEKFWAYNRLKKLWNNQLDDAWLVEQYKSTISYYINSNVTNAKDIKKLRKWCSEHSDTFANSIRLFVYISKLVFKKTLKKFIRS